MILTDEERKMIQCALYGLADDLEDGTIGEGTPEKRKEEALQARGLAAQFEAHEIPALKTPLNEDGTWTCPSCFGTHSPKLIETGYEIEHDYTGYDPGTKSVKASGWDGNSEGVSDEGTDYVLQCGNPSGRCVYRESFPEDLVIEWE